MNIPLALHARQGQMLGLRNVIDTGGAGAMRLFEGSMPATLADLPSSLPLATIDFALPAGAIGVIGVKAVLAVTVPRTTAVENSGHADYAQIVDGTGATICYMEVSTVGAPDAKPVLLSNQTLYEGGEVVLVSCIFAG